MSIIKYRPEIDGLRAVAVISVMLFHINSSWLPGGFIGVDIFFVISGYLITKIIYTEITQKTFSFSLFYQRRIKRIIPVFVAVTISTLLAGYFIQLPFDYKGLGNSTLAATVFLANIRYALVGNYFQADNVKPLLHTWSLSVEEQFYFIWPIVLIFAIRFFSSEYRVRLLVLFLMVSSFILATWMASEEKFTAYAYFLLPTRAGELLIGSYLAMLPTRINASLKQKEYLSFLGAVLILFSFIFINKQTTFPGFSAFVPCLGTALIIWCGNANKIGSILSLKPMIYLGLISYSLYMWHWPILTFARYLTEIQEFDLLLGATLAVIIILISWGSWFFIEKPVRNVKASTKKSFIFIYAIPSIFIICVSLMISKSGGYPERFDMPLSFTRVETIGCHNSLSDKTCFISKPNNSADRALLIGDSHAGHFSHFLKTGATYLNLSITDASAGSCKFYSDVFVSNRCEIVKHKIERELVWVKTVFIANRFDIVVRDDMFKEEYRRYILSLVDRGYNVYVFLQVPKFLESPLKTYAYHRRYGLEASFQTTVDEVYINANKTVTDLLIDIPKVSLLDFNKLICSSYHCSQFVDKKPIYFDDDHLNAYGSEWLAEKVFINDSLLNYKVGS